MRREKYEQLTKISLALTGFNALICLFMGLFIGTSSQELYKLLYSILGVVSLNFAFYWLLTSEMLRDWW